MLMEDGRKKGVKKDTKKGLKKGLKIIAEKSFRICLLKSDFPMRKLQNSPEFLQKK